MLLGYVIVTCLVWGGFGGLLFFRIHQLRTKLDETFSLHPKLKNQQKLIHSLLAFLRIVVLGISLAGIIFVM